MKIDDEHQFLRTLLSVETTNPEVAALFVYIHARIDVLEEKSDFVAKSLTVIKWLQPFIIAGLGLFIGSRL